jgi:hypothetical protein
MLVPFCAFSSNNHPPLYRDHCASSDLYTITAQNERNTAQTTLGAVREN